MSYILRHLELGGPVLANIENVRDSDGRSIFHGYSTGISEKMMANWNVYSGEIRDSLMPAWDPANGTPRIISDGNFRVLGLARADDPSNKVLVPYDRR